MPGILQSILDFQNTGRAAKAISNANDNAMKGVLGASATGQAGVSDAARLGIQGVEGAVGAGQAGVTDAFNTAAQGLKGAGVDATGAVKDATGIANAGLTDTLNKQTDVLNPYLDAGKVGLSKLTDMAGGPGFQFNYDDYKNDPAFQFQLEQGQRAIQNSGSARGLGSSGAVMKELAGYGTGLAATHYGEAFERAKQQFLTNQQAGLQTGQALIGAGQNATGQFNSAQQNAGNQIAANAIGAGKYEGDTAKGIAELLAKLGIDVSQFNSTTGLTGALNNSKTGLEAALANSNTGLKASGMAGDYAVGSANSRASGILGQGAAVNEGIDGLGKLLMGLLGG